jgi:hypothetical protein
MREVIKARNLTKLVSEELNIPVEKVNAVVDFFYSELKKEILSGKHTHILLQKVGTFKGNTKKTAGYIKFMKNFIAKLEEKGDFESLKKADEIKRNVIVKQDYLERLLKEWDEKKQYRKNMGK